MKTIVKIRIIALAILFSASLSSLFAQKSIELEYNLNTGDVYEFVTNIDQDISFEANGATMTLEQVLTFDMTSKVDKIEGDNMSKSFVFDKVTMNQKIFGMELNYSSDDSTTWTGMGAQIAQEMNKIIGKSVEVVMDNKGNIEEMDLSEITDNDELTNNLTSGNTYAVYPAGKVTVGESWETDIEPLKDSEMKVHVKYTLLKASKKQAIIGVEGLLTGNDIQGEQINLNGTTVGEMTVDRATGMLVTSSIDIELALEIDQQGVKIPANIMSTTVTNAVKVN